jgi:hypothetical protein
MSKLKAALYASKVQEASIAAQTRRLHAKMRSGRIVFLDRMLQCWKLHYFYMAVVDRELCCIEIET